MSIQALTNDNFDQVVDDNEIVIIDFWAEWCEPCKAFGKIYEEMAEKHQDIVFTNVDVESEQELAADFNVKSIPLVMVIRQNIVLFDESGVMSASSFDELLQEVKSLDMDQIRLDIEDHQA